MNSPYGYSTYHSYPIPCNHREQGEHAQAILDLINKYVSDKLERPEGLRKDKIELLKRVDNLEATNSRLRQRNEALSEKVEGLLKKNHELGNELRRRLEEERGPDPEDEVDSTLRV